MGVTVDLSVRGRMRAQPALVVSGVRIMVRGRALRIGEIFDEYWLERSSLPDAGKLITALRAMPDRPDIFTFAQRVPDSAPGHPYYRETDNVAVLPIRSFEQWLAKQCTAATRRNVKAAEKRGITVREVRYDDAFVRGIKEIYDETPFRAGRRFWHYGKDLESVRRENATYAERSSYLAAHHGENFVGYLKVVWDSETGAIMQILSKLGYRDSRPNNALLAMAVRLAAERGVRYLLYEKFEYGRKGADSLTQFKERSGFRRMDIPRYFVPLTVKGSIALKLQLHRGLRDRVPEAVAAPLREMRSRLVSRLASTQE